MMRGAAALLVLIGHVRAMVFLDLPSATSARWLALPLYLLTGLGHQAVIIFFALSGYLVGGRALMEIGQGRWDAADYAVHRFARLWTVLIPALVVTAMLDWLARDVLGLAGYHNEYNGLMALGPVDFVGSSTAIAFIGNIAFLQTILVPTFGTDVPLWSLANEFWYYFVVPFAWITLFGRLSVKWRVGAGVLAIAAVLLLPPTLVMLGSIWLCGALAYRMRSWVGTLSLTGFLAYGAGSLIALALALCLALFAKASGNAIPVALRDGLAGDLALGIACAALLPWACVLPSPGGLYGRASSWLSDISFTLYATHFPLVFLLWTMIAAPTQYLMLSNGWVIAVLLIGSACLFAWAMWWAFERHTPSIRRLMMLNLVRNRGSDARQHSF